MSLRLDLTSLKIEDRITPSDRRLGVWIAVTVAIGFILSGVIGFLWIFLGDVAPQWRLLEEFKSVRCVVQDAKIEQSQTNSLYRPLIYIKFTIPAANPDNASRSSSPKEYFVWTYDFNTIFNPDSSYSYSESEAKKLKNAFIVSRGYTCWYDPHDPQKVVLFCCWTWTNILLLVVPASLFLLGLSSLIHLIYVYRFGRIIEKKAATQSAGSNNSESGTVPETQENAANSDESTVIKPTPNVPSIQSIIDSPGVKMKYRLPLDKSPVWSLAVILIMCIAWGALCLASVSVAVGGFLDHRPEWNLVIAILPFFLIWLALIFYFLRIAKKSTAIAPTLLEMDEAPLHPGESASALLIQMGAFYIFKLEVNLICEEEAVFTYGTDVRSEKNIVYRANLLSEQNFNITSDERFSKFFDVYIPANAMHSFDSPHNRIVWQLEVYGEVEIHEGQTQSFTRRFVLVVVP